MGADIIPIKRHIGAMVTVSKEELLEPGNAEAWQRLLNERVVLVFPELGLSDAEQLAFTDLLGTRINFARSKPKGDQHPDIYPVTLEPEINPQPEYVLGTFFWHMDGVTVDIPPPRATLISARKVAPRGGQTEFANCFAAYEELDERDRAEIEGLQVVHSVYASVRPFLEFGIGPADWQGVSGSQVHPLVWTHASGRKSLLIGSHAQEVVGMPLPEGRALLARLLEWTGQPDFSYCHEWTEGDLVVWNNCGAVHRVRPYGADSGRMMHRSSVAGTERIA